MYANVYANVNVDRKSEVAFGILTDFETVGNMAVLLGESAMHSHLSKPPNQINIITFRN